MSNDEQPKGKKKMTDRVPTSFRLEKQDVEDIRFLARKWDRSASSVIRQLVREAMKREQSSDSEQ